MWFSVLKELNATNGRELVQSFVNVFVKLFRPAVVRNYFDVVSLKSI